MGPIGNEPCVIKRGLEYGVRAPIFYGNPQEQTGEQQFSTNTYRKLVLFLQKSLKNSVNLQEFTG